MAVIDYFVSALASSGTGTGSEVNPWHILDAKNAFATGMRLNIKNDGVYDLNWGESLYFNPSGISNSGVAYIRGYTSVTGDNGRFQIRGLGTSSLYQIRFGQSTVVENGDFEKSDLNEVVQISSCVHLRNCRIVNAYTGTTNALALYGTSDGNQITNCYLESRGTSLNIAHRTVQLNGASIISDTIVFSSGNLNGLFINNNGCIALRNVIYCRGTGSMAIDVNNTTSVGDAAYVLNNSIMTGPNGVGIVLPRSTANTRHFGQLVADNVIYNAATGIRISTDPDQESARVFINNAINSSVGTAYDVGDALIINPISLTNNPFVSPTDLNFSLNDASGGGLLLKTGVARNYPYTNTTGFLDIGAIQHFASTGSSSTIAGTKRRPI